MTRRLRILIAGAGVAGAVAARGLAELPGLEVICLEKAEAESHDDAGTGLNVGPNAVKALALHLPDLARRVVEASIPWRRWTIGLTDGTRLFDLDLATVADNPGIRIRWAEFYRLLRADLPIRYGEEVRRIDREPDGRLRVEVAAPEGLRIVPEVDLLIAADGRYSSIRARLAGPCAPRHLGVSMYRVLLPCAGDCPIDDYGQWFNGPNRLLAFRVPGDLVYCAGAFPLDPPDGPIPERMKRPETLRRLYTPPGGPPSPEAAFLIEGIARRADEIHWARVQEAAIVFAVPGWPVLMVGDASHPMVPTLGQGATQAVEDACVVIDEVRRMRETGGRAGALPERIEARRRDRVAFVMEFSRDASDTMRAGADPAAGTLAKLAPPFQERLRRLYRDVPAPGGGHSPSPPKQLSMQNTGCPPRRPPIHPSP